LVVGGGPAFKPGESRADLASLVDVAPTVAAMMGWRFPEADGIDLATERRLPDDGVAFEAAGMDLPGCHAPALGAWRGDEKAVIAPETQSTRAWRRTDVGVVEVEPTSLSAGGRLLVQELGWEPPASPPPGDLSSPQANDAATETLRALGYVQ
jgi:arylsulfatase A-like enzyme